MRRAAFVSLTGAAAALQALAMLGRGDESRGAAILADILDAHRLVDALDEEAAEPRG